MLETNCEKVEILGRWIVCRHRLESGLKIIIFEDHSTPLISFHTWFSVGSRHEREGKTGLAHLFEHLMFESTLKHPSGSFDREMEKFGAETNAATWFDWTYYHETFPPEALELVLDFEPDRMTNLIIDDETVEREKSVVMNERKYRVEDNVSGAIEEALYKTAFVNHPYRHPTIGYMEDIRSLTLDDCREFYRTYYSPSNATIVVAGNIKHDEIIHALKEKYAKIPSSVTGAETVFNEPPQMIEKRLVFQKEVTAAKISIGYHSPSLIDPDNAAISILAIILCGGETGRLVRKLIHETELASNVSSHVGTHHLPALLEFHFDLREGKDPEEVISIFDAEIERLLQDGVTEKEVFTAKNRILLFFYNTFSAIGGKAATLGLYETVTGNCTGAGRRIEALKAVTVEMVREVARKYLKPFKRTIVIACP